MNERDDFTLEYKKRKFNNDFSNNNTSGFVVNNGFTGSSNGFVNNTSGFVNNTSDFVCNSNGLLNNTSGSFVNNTNSFLNNTNSFFNTGKNFDGNILDNTIKFDNSKNFENNFIYRNFTKENFTKENFTKENGNKNMNDEYNQLNPKQIFWIKRRKIRRDALDAIMIEQDKNYIHESRHRHAMNRMRASSGRFLTKEEMLKLQNKKE